MARALLLLDVDGVLQPTGSSLPPGFERIVTDHASVVLRPDQGRWLAALLGRVEMVWATTWGDQANDLIGSPLGLPPMAHIDLTDLPRHGTRKLHAVQQYAGDQPLAWIDDELYDDAIAWADERPPPTLLRRTRGSVGLTHDDVDAVQAFLRALETPTRVREMRIEPGEVTCQLQRLAAGF